ncbi:MAG TPA: hypothetical protein VIY86_06520, partial [Pirellulaceae bacterium]
IIVDESSTWYVWLKLPSTYGSKPFIESGSAWWNGSTSLSGAPQTDSSGNTYIPIGTITVGADADDPHTTEITMYVDSDIEIVPRPLNPFAVQQHTPDPMSPTAADWRTLRVSGGGSTINGTHADNDGDAGTPLDIEVDESAATWFVWLALTIDTTTGDITGITIDHGPAGWAVADGDETDYPAQPAPAANEFPSSYYILIVDGITTSDDTDQVLFIPTHTTQTALVASGFVLSLDCTNGVVNYRFGHSRA